MDIRFSKREYAISCFFTLFFTALVAASLFDISTCGFTGASPSPAEAHESRCAAAPDGDADRGSARSDAASSQTTRAGAGSADTPAHAGHDADKWRVRLTESMPKSLMYVLFGAWAETADAGAATAPTTQPLASRLRCHTVDIMIWCYILALMLFVTHKYVAYRSQGLHYFLLDYCYFHNAVLVMFLVGLLVEVRWSDEPIVSFVSRVDTHDRDMFLHTDDWLFGGHDPLLPPETPPPRTTAEKAPRKVVRFHDFFPSLGAAPVAYGTVLDWLRSLPPDGVYLPVSIDILTISYALANLSTVEAMESIIGFFTLLAGTFGPILGAILMWKNALLFHSFDRMSSCYLHLAPAVVQGLMLHRLLTTATLELLAALAERGPGSPPVGQLPETNATIAASVRLRQNHSPHGGDDAARFSPGSRAPHLLSAGDFDSLCTPGTLCHHLRQQVTLTNLLVAHFLMFLIWQVLYHIVNETMRTKREVMYRWQLRRRQRAEKAFEKRMSRSHEETLATRPVLAISEGCIGDPTSRVTAYTWMMEHPPLGKTGVFYRAVTIFGKGRLPTTILFSVMQWLIHVVFFLVAYPLMYLSVNVSCSAWPLLLYLLTFVGICVYNAAVMNKHWISKLQALATLAVKESKLEEGESSGSPNAQAKKEKPSNIYVLAMRKSPAVSVPPPTSQGVARGVNVPSDDSGSGVSKWSSLSSPHSMAFTTSFPEETPERSTSQSLDVEVPGSLRNHRKRVTGPPRGGILHIIHQYEAIPRESPVVVALVPNRLRVRKTAPAATSVPSRSSSASTRRERESSQQSAEMEKGTHVSSIHRRTPHGPSSSAADTATEVRVRAGKGASPSRHQRGNLHGSFPLAASRSRPAADAAPHGGISGAAAARSPAKETGSRRRRRSPL